VLLPANPDMGVVKSSPIATRIAATVFMVVSFLSSAGWSSVGHHLHPTARAGFNVGVVALGVLTVVPIIGFLLILLSIHLGLLFDNDRWRWIVRVVWIIGVSRRAPPSRAERKTKIIRISMPMVPAIPMIISIAVITTRSLITAGPVIATRPVITSRSSRVRGQSACK
jgi:hypothetical protein